MSEWGGEKREEGGVGICDLVRAQSLQEREREVWVRDRLRKVRGRYCKL